jgi:hypothetical protein
MMRAFGADDGKVTRTPAAWMISPSLHTQQHQHTPAAWMMMTAAI